MIHPTRSTNPTGRAVRALGAVCSLLAGLVASTAWSQVPDVSLDGLPATPLKGEEFCVDANFTNTGAATGFGPYLIAVVEPGIQRLSISFVDIEPQLEQIGTFDASGELTDPISGITLNGVEGGTAWIARYPIGSVTPGQPPLVMTVCAEVTVGEPIGVDKVVQVIPGFEFGDTATGTNGPITEAPVVSTVTPELARIEKGNSAPEGERPPGPSHPFQYTWSVNISAGALVENLLLVDDLPPGIQWTGDPIGVSGPLALGCGVTQNPNPPPVPQGTVIVECTAALGTSGAADLTVSVPVYITDILNEALPDSESIVNTVDFDYSFDGTDYTASADSTVDAVHAAVQKSVAGTPLPGGRLTYTISFQLTDYPDAPPGAGANSFIVQDVIPDGLSFDGTVALVINGAAVPIVPTVAAGPGPGETTVTWDISAAAGGQLDNGSRGTLTFETTILPTYANGDPVQASDPFGNQPTLDYVLTSGGSGNDGSSAGVSIRPNAPDKRIASPNPVPPVLEPGQEVVYELTLDIPAGNTSDVVFVDFLPRPVFDVNDFDESTDLEILPPFDALNPVVDTDAGDNSVRIEFGDIVSPVPETLTVLLTARIVGEPFAPNLFLTNLLQSSYTNTNGDTITDLQAVGGTVGAPKLVITKGVIATDNAAARIQPAPPADPSQATADSDVDRVDAFDEITYLVTVENVGSTLAYNVRIDDNPVSPELSCSEPAAGDLVNGNGDVLNFIGSIGPGIILEDPLAPNDGTLGAPYGADTALLTLRCTLGAAVEPLQTYTNEAGVTWTSVPSPLQPFPRETEIAEAVIDTPVITKIITAIDPGYAGDLRSLQIGEIATYELQITVPEGTSSSVRLEDQVPNGMAFVDVVSVTADSPDLTTSEGSFADVEANAGFLAQGGGETAPDRRLVFGPAANQSGFGTISNSNADNASNERITIVYRVKALNASVNTAGERRRNRARWLWQPPGASRQQTEARAQPLRIIEPELRLNKVFTPDTGDDATPPLLTLTLDHANGSSGDAFDVSLTDRLPADLFVDGTVDTSLCPVLPDSLTVTDVVTSDELFASWSSFPAGSSCTLRIQTRFAVPPVAGRELRNCAETLWESLSVADQPLATPPNNTLGVERTGSDADPGQLNNYRFEACDTFSVFGVGIDKRVTTTDQAHTDDIPGTPPDAESLTIGEQVTFELVVTIPDANVPELEVTDLLPITDNVLELLSATTTFVGSDLTPANPNPAAVIDDRDGDGINDRAILNYGLVLQAADGSTDDDDRIRIEVVARVRDVLVNRNNDQTSNGALVRFLPGITASDNAALEIVEPLLRVSKAASASEAEAGDTVTYTVRLEHDAASRIDAKDVTLEDVIPAELNVIGPSVGLGAVCSQAPDSGPVFAGGVLTAGWDSFPRGAVCEIEYQATVDISAVIGQSIVNVVETNWTSLDTQGDADDREYSDSDQWTLNISEPGLSKALTGSDQDFTGVGALVNELTIGETGTFTIAADFPDGTTQQVFVFDELPTTDVALQITGTRITAIGADLSLSAGLGVGDPALDCSGGAQTCAVWALGDVVNQPDIRPEPDADDRITFEVDVIVLDDPLNTGEDSNVLNTSRLDSLDLDLVASASFDIVEPLLEVSKLTENGTLPAIIAASEIQRYTLVIDHLPDSTAQANTLVIRDTLNPGGTPDILWVNDSTVVSDCPGFSIVSTPAPGADGVAEFSVSSLDLLQLSCSISYDVQAQALLPILGRYPNDVTLEWESAPGSPESRPGAASDSNALVSLSTATLSKVITGTSVPDTGNAVNDPLLDDLTIGEEVNYRIVAVFSEGTTPDVQLVDTIDAALPDGPTLEFVSGNVISIGANLTTSAPGTPVVGPANVITIDYGTVENVGDTVLDADDTIVYELVARVVDVPNNVDGVQLRNEVVLNFDGGSESTGVDLELVEPELAATKIFSDLNEGVATIEISLSNTGNAPAYEPGFEDEFDETFWLPGTLTPLNVPPGFELTEASAGGVTTVSLVTNGNPANPEEVLAPGETLNVSFSLGLVNGGIVGVPQIDNTVDVTATSLPGINPAERSYATSATDSLFFPDLSLEKTASGPNDPARPGDTLTYTLTLDNTGPAAATDVLISDTPDAIGEFVAGSVVPSAGGTVISGNTPGDTTISVSFASVPGASSATVSYEVVVPLPYPDGQTAPEELVNQASADAREQQGIVSDDPATADPDDPTVVPIDADPLMTVSKDDQVALTAPGATLVYRIDYGNIGDQDATGVVLTETVPANTVFSAAASTPGWSCADGSGPGTLCDFSIGSLSVGGDTVQFAVVVDTPLPPGVTEISNTVSITDDGLEFDPGDPVIPSTDSDTEITPIGGAAPQLQIRKDDGGIAVTPGQRYSYLIDYANIGNQGATGVVITETVPDDVTFSEVASLPSRWSCPNGSPPGTQCSIVLPLLLAGAGDQVRFGLDVIFPAAAGRDLIVNDVEITDDGANSPVPSTAADSDDTPLIAVPDIYVSKSTDANIVREGDSVLYTAEYGNQGNQDATGVVVRELVPAGAEFDAAGSTPTVWSCADRSPAGTLCEYQGGAVSAGFMETLFFAINIVGTPDDRQLLNVIEANDDFTNGVDPTPENNIDRVVNLFPTLSIDTMSRGGLLLLSLLVLWAGARQRAVIERRR